MAYARNLYVRDLALGMTRGQVVEVWGEPDLKGGTSRKYPAPSILKYGPVEVVFGPRADDGLTYVWVRNADDDLVYLLPPRNP